MDLHDHFAHHESGHFRGLSAWTTARVDPVDHLVIWVRRGGVDLEVYGRAQTAAAGDVILLRPGVAHRYRPAEGGWEWWWVHFGGSLAPELGVRLAGRAGGPVRRLGEDPRLVHRFTELVRGSSAAAVTPASRNRLHLDTCALSLLGLVIDRLESPMEDPFTSASDLADLTGWILDHLDQPFGLADLARVSGWSPAQLHRLTRRELGRSPMELATQLRMRQARRLLAESSLTVTEIAAMVGFVDPLHFSRRFRQVVGSSPTAYRDDPKPASA